MYNLFNIKISLSIYENDTKMYIIIKVVYEYEYMMTITNNFFLVFESFWPLLVLLLSLLFFLSLTCQKLKF